jgi:predicted PurR-regulated permease PerM
MLVDLPHLRRVAESLIPERARPEVLVLASRLNRAIGGFFRGQLVVALIVGVMVSIGLAIIGLPFWLLIGMIAGVFNMIPLIGPYIGAVPGIVIALTAGDGFSQAIWVAVIMTAAQQIDNHFITPNVMQRVVKLHPAAVMLALLAGGTLGGLFGILLSVPIAAVLKILVGHFWRTYVLGEPIEEIASAAAHEDGNRGGVVEDVLDCEPDDDGEGDPALAPA